MVFITNSPEETEAVGANLGRILEESGRSRAFIALRGEMGVGKTAFTEAFDLLLVSEEHVSSASP